MGVDEAGHDDAAAGVKPFGLRILVLKLPPVSHGADLLSVDQDCAVRKIGGVFVAGQHSAVSDQQHVFHLRIFSDSALFSFILQVFSPLAR